MHASTLWMLPKWQCVSGSMCVKYILLIAAISRSSAPATAITWTCCHSGVPLDRREVRRFYNLWFLLLHYVDQERKLISAFPSQWSNAGVDPPDAMTLRDALWADGALREAFIVGNPAHLSAQAKNICSL